MIKVDSEKLEAIVNNEIDVVARSPALDSSFCAAEVIDPASGKTIQVQVVVTSEECDLMDDVEGGMYHQ